MCFGHFEINVCVIFIAKGTVLHPLGTLNLHVISQVSPLHLHITVNVVTIHNLIGAVCVGVFFSISQTTLPLAAAFFVRAYHLEAANSSVIKGVCMESKSFTVDRTCAILYPYDTLPTEQVPTSGLHWVRDQIQTDGALEFIQKPFLSVHKVVLDSSVAVGGHAGCFLFFVLTA